MEIPYNNRCVVKLIFDRKIEKFCKKQIMLGI